MPDILQYVASMHESRELEPNLIPSVGTWLEVGKFTPIIETFDIKKRYECIKSTILKGNVIEVTLKQLDVEAYNNQVNVLLDKIMTKHGSTLAQSLAFCILHGCWVKREELLHDNQDYAQQVSESLQHVDNQQKLNELRSKRELNHIINKHNKALKACDKLYKKRRDNILKRKASFEEELQKFKGEVKKDEKIHSK